MTPGDLASNILYILLGLAGLVLFVVLARQAFRDPASRKAKNGDKPDGTL